MVEALEMSELRLVLDQQLPNPSIELTWDLASV